MDAIRIREAERASSRAPWWWVAVAIVVALLAAAIVLGVGLTDTSTDRPGQAPAAVVTHEAPDVAAGAFAQRPVGPAARDIGDFPAHVPPSALGRSGFTPSATSEPSGTGDFPAHVPPSALEG
jgi:hypothetical protein